MAALMLILAAASSALAGRWAIQAVWPARWRGLGPAVTLASLGLGLGMALSAAHCFAWRAMVGRPGMLFAWIDLLALPALMWGISMLFRRQAAGVEPADIRWDWRSADRWLGVATIVAVLAAAIAFAALLKWESLGQWDGWAIWNHKARFMYRGEGEAWRGMFAQEVWFTHPDYPLLVPALVTRMWAYAGHETVWGPWLVSGLFSAMAAGLLFGLACWLRGPRAGCWAVLLLAGSERFLWYGAAQYSDVPLMFFTLAAAGMLVQAGRAGASEWRAMALAGLFAGWGMWVKNEGILLAASLVAGWLAARWMTRRGSWQGMLALLVGMLPGLAMVTAQRMAFPAQSYLVADQEREGAVRQKLADPSRYATIARGIVAGNLELRWVELGPARLPLPNQPMVVLLLALPLAMGWQPDKRDRLSRLGIAGWLLLALGMYAGVAVIMPYDLERLMLDWPRMQMQAWGVMVLWMATGMRWANGHPAAERHGSENEAEIAIKRGP